MASRFGFRRFVAFELLLWASLYPAYLASRSETIGDRTQAVAHANSLVHLERITGLQREGDLQSLFGFVIDFFSAYYMLGFGPLLVTVLVWLGLRHRRLYRELQTLLLTSLGLAVIGYVFYPTAPPRLLPALGLADTVGMSAHDTGSVAGIRFNPYSAMPSMHVGWALLVGIVGFRAARSRVLKSFFGLHPLVMVLTVTATGNHYFMDAIAGAAAALVAVLALAGLRRLRARRAGPGAEIIPFPRSASVDVRRAA
jgi:hypothetical protein